MSADIKCCVYKSKFKFYAKPNRCGRERVRKLFRMTNIVINIFETWYIDTQPWWKNESLNLHRARKKNSAQNYKFSVYRISNIMYVIGPFSRFFRKGIFRFVLLGSGNSFCLLTLHVKHIFMYLLWMLMTYSNDKHTQINECRNFILSSLLAHC